MKIIGLGVDLESAESFRSRPFAKRKPFYKKLFTAAEIRYALSFRDPAPRFAARFCAKEAFVKAARRIVRVQVTDVEVRRNGDGAPRLVPRSKRKAVRDLFRKHDLFISLSHSRDWAVAFVLIAAREKRG